MIPQQGYLPIVQPFIDLANATGTTPIVKPIVDLVSPVLKVLIDLGYDRTANPGIPQTLKLFPRVNPVTLTVDLVVAVGQGIHDAVNDIGATTLAPRAPLAPSSPSPFSTLALSGSQTPPVDVPKTRPPVDNSLLSMQNKDPKPDPGMQSPTSNGSLIKPFNLLKLPKSSTTSNGTPATKPKGWKPGAALQKVTTGIKDAIDDLTKPHSSTTPGGETDAPAQANAPHDAPQRAAA